MNNPNFTTTILVDQTPAQIFAAINNVSGWWPQIEGRTDALGAVFTHNYEDMHRCTIEIVELIPNRKIAWRVLDNYFQFTKDKTEWKDNTIIFDIARKGAKTEIRFTQEGLVPDYECFDVCSNAWTSVLNDELRSLIGASEGSAPKARRKAS